MTPEDRTRLQHMVEAAHEVVQFTSGHWREELDTNLLLVRGLSMSLGILGEAAAHISDETRQGAPEIPWREIVAMRNFLVHEYFRVDLDLLWLTAMDSVPEVLPALENLLMRSE